MQPTGEIVEHASYKKFLRRLLEEVLMANHRDTDSIPSHHVIKVKAARAPTLAPPVVRPVPPLMVLVAALPEQGPSLR